MHKNILIAAVAVAVTAGAALAQNPPPGPPRPAAGQDQQRGPGGPGFGGPGFRGGRGGPGGFMRQPPTPQDIQQRNATAFARIDANKDGKVTFEEFRADLERQRMERQRQMFKRFSGGADSVTLDQMNARALERLNDRQQRRGQDGRGQDGRGQDGRGRGGRGGPTGQPPAAPAR